MWLLKAGIHYMAFAKIFAMIYCLEELTLVAKSQNHSTDFAENLFILIFLVYDGHS